MVFIWEIIIILGILLLIKNLRINKKQPQNTYYTTEPEPEIPATEEPDYSQCYQSRLLLTKNEWYAYKKLKIIAEEKDLYVCPKVRLLDIIEPRKGQAHYKTLLYKIQSKHVDFVITDPNLRIKAILELDDTSHEIQARQDRDTFVNQILTSVGYKVIHTKAITDDTLNDI